MSRNRNDLTFPFGMSFSIAHLIGITIIIMNTNIIIGLSAIAVAVPASILFTL